MAVCLYYTFIVDFLSPGQKSKLKDRQRKYKLFAGKFNKRVFFISYPAN